MLAEASQQRRRQLFRADRPSTERRVVLGIVVEAKHVIVAVANIHDGDDLLTRQEGWNPGQRVFTSAEDSTNIPMSAGD